MLEKDAQGTGPRGAARLGVVRNETRDALPFILIGKYNDRPPPPHREARVRTSGGTREKEERKERGRRRAEGGLGKVANAGCRAFVTGR